MIVTVDQAPREALVEPNSTAITFMMSGPIGGYDAYMEIYNGRGEVDLGEGGTRQLTVRSCSGNKLIIDAYLKGRYIGYYSGTLYDDFGNYKGIFYNTKTGGRVDFDLYLVGD